MMFVPKEKVVFYEKTGCAGNARQKALLKKSGVSFEVRSLLDTPWTKEVLEPFFEGLEPAAMINPFAPAIKNKEIDIDLLAKEELLGMMIQTPLLIKRPLIQIGKNYLCGFDIEKLNTLLGVNMPLSEDVNSCSSEDKCKSV